MQGLDLSATFYHEAIRPILDTHYPSLPHAAALLGPGSEVLGFDDAMSTDHHWGPRLLLFLAPDDHARLASALHTTLAHHLPTTFCGYPTNWTTPDPNDSGTQHPQRVDHGPVNHRVELVTIRDYVRTYLGLELDSGLDSADWLTLPTQRLRAFTAGTVFHDDVGLQAVRDQLAWYPHDVWLYLLAAGWTRIGQEEHLMGRAGLVGDELGSALLGARLARDVMRLCFLMEKVYAPYPKWFGTAFKGLDCAPQFLVPLRSALAAPTWQARERHLVVVYEALARLHNRLQLTDPLPETTCSFHGRPFQVIAFHGFAGALLACIQDPEVRAITTRPIIGNIDLISDNTDLLESVAFRPKLRSLYT